LAISTQILFQRRIKLVSSFEMYSRGIQRRRPFHGLENEAVAFSEGERKKCLAHKTTAQFLCI